ncbi:VgrG-related protein [Sphaerothrix gracilis]|uniref:VgrG-related protein n=1 Tax=Sphaerothrix gracilis TaxID=3151835 RepID=UPI0031FC7050
MTVNYRALPVLKINDEEAETELAENILQITVEESLHRPGLFTLVIRNDYQPGTDQDEPWRKVKQLEIGDTVSIGFDPSLTQAEEQSSKKSGQQQEDTPLIQGEITSIEAHFTERTQAPIIIRGYDVSHRLHRGRYNRSFQNLTDSDAVEKIAKENGIDLATVDDSGEPHDYLFQENQTNMEFLRERANRIGFELFIQDGKLNFRKPDASDPFELVWLKDIRSFRVRLTSTEQVQEVEVRAWDYITKKPIISTAKSEKLITDTEIQKQKNFQNEKRSNDVNTAFDGMKAEPRMIVVDQPVFKPKEADAIAQALCNELGGQFIVADAKGEGNPKIRPGVFIELKDLGPYSGKYYVTETRHVYAERVYTTEFCVRGLRSGDLLTTLAPEARLRPGQTLLVGIVTDNEDPDGLGRVKVKLPTLTEDHNSNWARVVSIGAANNRGFDCLPEIDDEVLIAFEHGNIHRPYVLGGVWNGKDTPPNSVADNIRDGQVRLRTFKTRTGHQIQFIEEDKGNSKAGVKITTKGGHQIYLNDSDGSISISSTGNLKISAKKDMDITADGNITVRGNMIYLN